MRSLLVRASSRRHLPGRPCLDHLVLRLLSLAHPPRRCRVARRGVAVLAERHAARGQGGSVHGVAAAGHHDAAGLHAVPARAGAAHRAQGVAANRRAARRLRQHGHARRARRLERPHARRVARGAARDELLEATGKVRQGHRRGLLRATDRHEFQRAGRGRHGLERRARSLTSAPQKPPRRARLDRRRLERRQAAAARRSAVPRDGHAHLRSECGRGAAVAGLGFGARHGAELRAYRGADFHPVPHREPSAARGEDAAHH